MNTELALQILDDPAASDWLKKAVFQLLDRDPVDAANDVEALYNIFLRHLFKHPG